MGRTLNPEEREAAHAFARAAAALAGEAVIAMGNEGRQETPSPGPMNALALAARHAADLERLANQEVDLTSAYDAAARALEVAAAALAAARPRPWVHRIKGRPAW